jgi:GT2 family glycosyltransferase
MLERQALLILGMHRAGTSALARVAALRGAGLPEHILPPNEGNATGYWEPQAIVDLNTRILASLDLTWDDPFAALQLSSQAIPAAFHEQARKLIQDEYGDAPLFVVKDPRCTLLQGFWVAVMRSLAITVCPVVIMRPWQDVVASLVRRDGTSAESAALLYVAHGLAAADACDRGASFLTYQQLLGDWRGATDRVAREAHFTWPIGESAAEPIAGFLHAAASRPGEGAVPPAIAAWADQVWHWCEMAATDGARATAGLEAVREEFSRLAAMVAPLLRDRARMQHETEAQRERALGERDSALDVYRQTDVLLHATQADFKSSREEIVKLQKERDDLLQLFQSTEAQLLDARRDHARAQADLAATQDEREQLLVLFNETKTRLQAERDELLALYQSTDGLLRKTQADYVERDQQRASLSVELQSMRNANARLQADLATIIGSRSWKLTRPMRYAMRQLRGDGMKPPAAPSGLVQRPEERPLLSPSTPLPFVPESGIQPVVQRPHAELRAFLAAEFDDATASLVASRIDHYRLPLPGLQAQATKDIACDEAQALAWARALATQAASRPQPSGMPDVSIVVPVFNQLPFTLACIDALLSHESRYSFEILVGDDGSTDATAAALSIPITGVRHIRHASNLGFVRNCNATATEATGRHVLFLNNDTLVLPHWLDELIGVLDADPGIGLAGSKLVFADGRLQECGAIVWRDGSAWNYGRLSDPRRPEFCYLRDVDYVSGASIALPRSLWEELGGFDELFVPAYAEDADLAFRIRARGLRTVVQPLSQVIHFEGITSGTDLGSGAKAYQVENLRKLKQRWADALSSHRDNAHQPELEKERDVRKRALFIDHCTPTPNEDAGSLVASEIMQIFTDSGYKVTFIPEDNFAHMGATTADLQRRGIEAIYHPAYSRMAAFLAARDDDFDVIFLHRFKVGEAHMDVLRRRYPRARIVFLNADMHHLRELREAEMSADQTAIAKARQTREIELRVTSTADVALVHSTYELELLQQALPGTTVDLFPLIHDPVEYVVPLPEREGVCFVGGFRHPPNADGIRWFVETTWPLVRAVVPDARLYIVGSHMPPDIRDLEGRLGVHAVGFVDDLERFLARRRLSVAPLRYGAGAKGKVAGSLAQGVPVVSTPIGAEGMQLSPGENVLVGGTPEELAGHVVTLLTDDHAWDRMSEAGIVYARDVTSRAMARQRLRSILDRL